MRFKSLACALTATVMLAGGCSSGPRIAGEAGTANKASMDRLKSLAGTWEMKGEDGRQQVGSVFKVSSAGSVVCETMFPGTPHEMINVYHLDGDAIVATHYCAEGNQPRMRCTGASGNTYTFSLMDCTNLKSAHEPRMSELVLTLQGPDRLVEDWTSFKDGKQTEHVTFELVRKK